MSIHQEDIIILNIYVPNIRALIYKQKLTELKEEININTIIIGHFNSHPGRESITKQQI